MGCCWQLRRRRSNRAVLQLLCWFLLVLLLVVFLPTSCCQASRGGMQPFKGRPLQGGASNNFFGFLPRRPAPPSGPSRQHNSVGIESQRQKQP
ncbi:unnamed protein product [Miscanthus lutarioriparius]|uniref:Uncharacterized protein n=1 Tax=Miscanthus lutarioriparius TaxID=422564 RepID=A0A811QXB3_9POAL|nr:unnamed protein product [Miscanthus lutarioriparius]CAD6260933.1 unnamed protein product [Miscanthus lutarioriparius]